MRHHPASHYLPEQQAFFPWGSRAALHPCDPSPYIQAPLKAKKQLNLFTDTMIWIDEGNHVMNAQVIGGGTISDSISTIVKHCLEHGNHIGLATATYTRHDRCHIIPEDLGEKVHAVLHPLRPILQRGSACQDLRV